MNQLNLLQSFVEDLLDLRQLKDGVFALSPEPFDPNEVIKLICQIFDHQAQSKGIRIISEVISNSEQQNNQSQGNVTSTPLINSSG